MKMNMTSSIIIVIVLSITTLAQVSKQDFSATITGQVKDTYEHPIPNAKVLARLTPHTPGRIPTGYTDPQGNFSIVVRNPGTYRLYAGKEELFYPIADNPYYDVDRIAPPEIRVGDKEIIKAGTVLLNSQGAKLALRIIDADTGDPIDEVGIGFRRDDSPDGWLGTGLGQADAGKITVLVPSMPIRMEVQAAGYKNWYYGGDGTVEQAFPLYLIAGTTEELEVRLRKHK